MRNERARKRVDQAIDDTDPDDVLYLACAIACDGAIWSDDFDFEEKAQEVGYSTSDLVQSFDPR